MDTNKTLPSYHTMTLTLAQQEIGLTAAEIHGLISGMLCGGIQIGVIVDGKKQIKSWETWVYELTNEGVAYSGALSEQLQTLYAVTHNHLQDDAFSFNLLLPDESSVSVFDRADALSGWVNHFLLGLGLVQPKLAGLKNETGEAIDDLRNIAQLGYDTDEDEAMLASALEEVIEYVRVVALLCYNEFVAVHDTKTQTKPTLH